MTWHSACSLRESLEGKMENQVTFWAVRAEIIPIPNRLAYATEVYAAIVTVIGKI